MKLIILLLLGFWVFSVLYFPIQDVSLEIIEADYVIFTETHAYIEYNSELYVLEIPSEGISDSLQFISIRFLNIFGMQVKKELRWI